MGVRPIAKAGSLDQVLASALVRRPPDWLVFSIAASVALTILVNLLIQLL
jgi:hypothetical protein